MCSPLLLLLLLSLLSIQQYFLSKNRVRSNLLIFQTTNPCVIFLAKFISPTLFSIFVFRSHFNTRMRYTYRCLNEPMLVLVFIDVQNVLNYTHLLVGNFRSVCQRRYLITYQKANQIYCEIQQTTEFFLIFFSYPSLTDDAIREKELN